MKNREVEMGMKVKTLVTKEAYYGGIVPKGSIGTVGAVMCIPVFGSGYFHCVDFMIGKDKKRASFKANQIERSQI